MSGYPKQDDKFEELASIKPLWQFARLRQFGVQEKDFRTPDVSENAERIREGIVSFHNHRLTFDAMQRCKENPKRCTKC